MRHDIEQLAMRYMDSSLGEAEEQDLFGAVKSDPAAATRFAEISVLHVAIQKCVKARETSEWLQDAGSFQAAFDGVAATGQVPARKWNMWKQVTLAAAAVAVIATGIWLFAPPRKGAVPPAQLAILEIRDFSGEAAITRAGRSVPLQSGTRMVAGDIITTPRDGFVVLNYEAENTSLRLGGDSELLVASSAAGKSFNLKSGRLDGDVAKQPEGQPMVIATPHATATVVGTRFTIFSFADYSQLDVASGRMRFAGRDPADSVVVQQGEYAVTEKESGGLMHFGPVLFSDEFDNGLAEYEVWVEDQNGNKTPADTSIMKWVKVIKEKKDGRMVNCLQIDASNMGDTWKWLDVMPKKTFRETELAMWTDYMGIDPSGMKPEIEVGLKIADRDLKGVFKVTPIGAPAKLTQRKWINWFGTYRICRGADGRTAVESRNDLSGRPAFQGRAVFDGKGPSGFMIRFSAMGMKAVIDRVEVRRLLHGGGPPGESRWAGESRGTPLFSDNFETGLGKWDCPNSIVKVSPDQGTDGGPCMQLDLIYSEKGSRLPPSFIFPKGLPQEKDFDLRLKYRWTGTVEPVSGAMCAEKQDLPATMQPSDLIRALPDPKSFVGKVPSNEWCEVVYEVRDNCTINQKYYVRGQLVTERKNRALGPFSRVGIAFIPQNSDNVVYIDDVQVSSPAD